MQSPRSWLFAPGHNERFLVKAFGFGADAVLLDLEDAVPPELKGDARRLVREAVRERPCWVRVNRPRSADCAKDLEALGDLVRGLRIPKVESAADVAWVAERVPGVLLDCSIESAAALVALNEIASAPACTLLSLGNVDLANDLGIDGGYQELNTARSLIVIAARAAGKPPPSDGVYTKIGDELGLKNEANASRMLGLFGKSAIHPSQIPIINEVFTASPDRIAWAKRVMEAFEASGGAATKLSDGQFVDLPIADRARRVLRGGH